MPNDTIPEWAREMARTLRMEEHARQSTGTGHKEDPIARALVEAARRGLERAAKEAERVYAKDAFHFELGTACAAAIRKLMESSDGNA